MGVTALIYVDSQGRAPHGADMSLIEQTILEKKAALAVAVGAPLSALAERCAAAWPDADALDDILAAGIGTVSNCDALYCWNIAGVAVSSMVQPGERLTRWRGRDLSERPYLKNHLPFQGVMLSSVYESVLSHRPCITALQAVRRGGELLGFVAADFPVDALLRDATLVAAEPGWRQFRGDPAVRGTMFLQTRVPSRLDAHIDDVLESIAGLMEHHGVFHAKIHFSSGRCSFWLYDDPYSYRVHGVEEIVNPELCLAYPIRTYPEKAVVSPSQIRETFRHFKALRFADETIYLRSASINVINGLLGLTFSCDGSHYMPVAEFLKKDMSFWVGAANVPQEELRSA